MSMTDPFALHANPGLYVPRPATERILARLVTSVIDLRRPALLVGPPGIGKTFLLRCLAKRLVDQLLSVYIPIPTLAPTEICRWILDQLGEEAGSDPALTLANVCTRLQAQGSALLLLVDDFSAMPKETLKQLLELWWVSEGGLRLVFASIEDERCKALLPHLEGSVEIVAFRETMTAAETTEYVRARLRGSGVEDEVSTRFDDALLARIQRETGGVPALVNAAGETVLLALRYRRELPQEDLQSEVVPAQLEKVLDASTSSVGRDWRPAEDDFAAARLGGRRRKEESGFRAESEASHEDAEVAEAKRRAEEDAAHEAAKAVLAAQRRAEEEREASRRMQEEARLRAEAEETRAIAASILTREKNAAGKDSAKKGVEFKAWVAAATIGFVLLSSAAFWKITSKTKPATSKSVAPSTVQHREASTAEPTSNFAAPRSVAEPSGPATSMAETSQEPDRGALPSAALAEARLSESLALEPILVNVNAAPWASIEIDGIEFGETPLAEIPLLPGLHKFVAKMPGGRVIEREIQIDQETQLIVFE